MRRYSNVDILLLTNSCMCWWTILASFCRPDVEGGGIVTPAPPATTPANPLVGFVAVLLSIMPLCYAGALASSSIGLSRGRPGGRSKVFRFGVPACDFPDRRMYGRVDGRSGGQHRTSVSLETVAVRPPRITVCLLLIVATATSLYAIRCRGHPYFKG